MFNKHKPINFSKNKAFIQVFYQAIKKDFQQWKSLLLKLYNFITNIQNRCSMSNDYYCFVGH